MSKGDAGIPIIPDDASSILGLGFICRLGILPTQSELSSLLDSLEEAEEDSLLARQGRLTDRLGPMLVQTSLLVQPDDAASNALVLKVAPGKRLLVEYLSIFAVAALPPVVTLAILPSPRPADHERLMSESRALPLPLSNNGLVSNQYHGSHLVRLYIDGPRELRLLVELWGLNLGQLLPGVSSLFPEAPPRATATLLLSGWVSDV